MNKKTILASLLVSSTLAFSFDFGALAKDAIGSLTEEKNSNTTTASSLSDSTVSQGLKEALKVGVNVAIKELSSDNGYLHNTQAKIPLPTNLQPIESLVRKSGGDKYADELIVAMNNAATNAAPKTADIFMEAIAKMDITDAKKILAGDNTAATDYFKSSSYEELKKVIAPIVDESVKSSSVALYYKQFNEYYKQGTESLVKNESIMGYAKTFGVDSYIKESQKTLNEHVTVAAIDGLFKMIAEKESDIRKNSVSQTTSLLQKVFGN